MISSNRDIIAVDLGLLSLVDDEMDWAKGPSSQKKQDRLIVDTLIFCSKVGFSIILDGNWTRCAKKGSYATKNSI